MKTWKLLRIVSLVMLLFLASSSTMCDSGSNNVKEVASSQIKLPNGATLRLYVFYIDKFEDNRVIWGDLEKLAREQEYTPGGNTCVLFFKNEKNIPNINVPDFRLGDEYKKDCIANFWRYPNGSKVFTPYPYEE